MAHAQIIFRASAKPRTAVRQFLAEWRETIAEWRRCARSRHELATLCDRCLRDMGVTRYDADREVRKPFWKA